MTIHHVEIFDDSKHEPTPDRRWGWQCQTCEEEGFGYFSSKVEAEKAAEHHRVEAATEELIEAGDLP